MQGLMEDMFAQLDDMADNADVVIQHLDIQNALDQAAADAASQGNQAFMTY